MNRNTWEKNVWYGVLLANLAFILYFWWQGNAALFGQGGSNILIGLGRITGLLGGFALLLQFFFIGRIPYLEKVFGFDTLTRIHHESGKIALYLIVLHPIFLTLGYAKLSGVTLWSQFVNFFVNYEDVAKAVIGLFLLFVIVGSSIYISRSRLKYEVWYFVHWCAYAVILLSFGHQFSVGTDLALSKIFYGYWFALYVFVFLQFVYFRFLRASYLLNKHKFYVSRIERETKDVVSIYISGKNMQSFSVQPGQFMKFYFLDKKRWWQSHPFSLSMVPNGREIRITPKQLGDFTNDIHNLKPGTQVLIDGPYGVFTKESIVNKKLLFIAGGIGITPIRSLAEQMQKAGSDCILLYGNKKQEDIVFKNELAQISLKTVHVLSDEPSFMGEKGYIDQEKIERLIPDVLNREVFVCGPPAMMDKVIETLIHIGVAKRNIHFEKFSLG